jgi:predicted phage terminase large subunit-like protein
MSEVCTHFEALYLGQCSELTINIPPGHTKSTLISVLAPAWVWTEDPKYQFMSASFDDGNARRHSIYTRVVMGSRWYQERWGNVLAPGDNPKEYYTTAGGYRFTTSVRGKGTGRHCDMFSIDDPVKAADAARVSDAALGKILEEANNWLGNTVVSRRSGPEQRISLIMQRLHAIDPSAYLMRTLGGVNLCLPALFERHRRCVTPFGGDRRTVEGEPLTKRLPKSSLDKIAAMNGGWGSLVVRAQLQQDPTPGGGTLFKRDRFGLFRPSDHKFRERISVLSVDCTFKEGGDTDYVAIQVWTYEPGVGFYCWYSHTERMGFIATHAAIRAALQAFPCTHVLIEDKANGPAIIETLRAVFPVVPCDPAGGKTARARAASFHVEAGRVYLAEGAGWAEDVITQATAFPRGEHDDAVDAMTQAVLWLAAQYGYAEDWAQAVDGWDQEQTALLTDPRAVWAQLYRLTAGT